MSAVFHGGRLDAAISEYGGKPEDWLDLSTGINPSAYPVPPISEKSWHRLPDEIAQQQLVKAARNYYRVPSGVDLVASNGTQAVLQNLPQVLVQGSAAIVSPTYEEHLHCWKQAGRTVFAPGGLNEAVDAAEIVVVVNPNNPTGATISQDVLVEAAQKLSDKSGFLIIDEAFADVFPELSCVPKMRENMIVLRSFGKFFGLAGLRLGFTIGLKTIMDQLQAKLGPWSVSGPALEIGTRALGDLVGHRRQEFRSSKILKTSRKLSRHVV